MTLRVGFVGGGGITETHALAAHNCPDLEIAAFCGTNSEKIATLVAEHGGEAFGQVEDMVARAGLDLVVIGSPSGLHAEQGLAAIAQGLHVLVEKPIDVTTERADALIAAAEAANVRLGVMFQDRLKPSLARLKDAMDGGLLGRHLLASARVKWHRPPEYYAGSPWRGTLALDGGAALINQGIHTVDLLVWLLGDVASVRSLTTTSCHAIEGEDIALALLEFRSGAVATLEATTCAWPGYPRRVEITGTEGTVTVEGDDVVGAELRTPRPELVSSSRPPASRSPSPKLAGADDHRRVLEDFVRAVRDGTAPVCDGREGRRSLALVEAIYAAGKAGGREVT